MWKRKPFYCEQEGGEGGGGGGVAQRPEHIPEKFWMADTGQVNVDALAKSYAELERTLHTAPEGVPASAAEYKIDLGELGNKFEIDETDPIFNWFRESAHKAKVPQDEFNKQAQQFADVLAKESMKLDTLVSSLGENGQQRVDQVNAFIQKLPEPEQKALSGFLVTPERVKAMEAIINAGKPPRMDNANNAPPSGLKTIEELRALQAKPEYYRDHNPAIVKEVQEGYAALERAKSA